MTMVWWRRLLMTMVWRRRVVDVAVTLYCSFEVVIKVITQGLYLDFKKAYLKDSFNVLDLFVVVVSVAGLSDDLKSSFSSSSSSSSSSGQGKQLQAFRSLRALRAIRPLRIIKRFENLKLVVNAIVNVVPDVINVLLLCVLFYVMFGIIFVQYFKGKFFACQGDVFEAALEAHDGLQALVEKPLAWAEMGAVERLWLGSSADCSSSDGGGSGGSGGSGGGTGSGRGCCGALPFHDAQRPTSRMLCACLGAEWGETVRRRAVWRLRCLRPSTETKP